MPDPITPSALWSRARADYLDGVTADEPDFPDSEVESAPGERPAPPPLTEDPEGWPAWAAFCETMRREHPDEPCWGEAIEAAPPPETASRRRPGRLR